MEKTKRRGFLKTAGLAGLAAGLPQLLFGKESLAKKAPAKNPLPRWRGFNLQYLYMMNRGIHEPQEEHFQWIADWGFNFVRLPMTYRAWLQNKDKNIRKEDVYHVDERALELIDKAVEYGIKHDVHVNLCFHHAPGYRIGISDRTGEPFRLFRDQEAVDAFTFHWEMFAKRYKSISPSNLSFNLFNEAPWPNDNFNGEVYKNAITPAVAAIRKENPQRIILADGAGAGNLWVPELTALGISQSVHCYIPGTISHYKVDWLQDRNDWPEPQWPGATGEEGVVWDRKRLAEFYAPWGRLVEQGVGVHLGETSGSHRLPHGIFLAWLEDVLDVFKEMDIGFGIWDFIGQSNFGILDSKRGDVAYEDWYGHKLDRKMLQLLQKY